MVVSLSNSASSTLPRDGRGWGGLLEPAVWDFAGRGHAQGSETGAQKARGRDAVCVPLGIRQLMFWFCRFLLKLIYVSPQPLIPPPPPLPANSSYENNSMAGVLLPKLYKNPENILQSPWEAVPKNYTYLAREYIDLIAN